MEARKSLVDIVVVDSGQQVPTENWYRGEILPNEMAPQFVIH